jgi:hypothetical protein
MLLIAVCPPLCLSLLSFAVFCSGEGERERENKNCAVLSGECYRNGHHAVRLRVILNLLFCFMLRHSPLFVSHSSVNRSISVDIYGESDESLLSPDFVETISSHP